jgi:hypothetical protein
MLSVIMLSVIMLSVITLCVIMLSVIVLNVIILSVVMLSIIPFSIISVMAPHYKPMPKVPLVNLFIGSAPQAKSHRNLFRQQRDIFKTFQNSVFISKRRRGWDG